MLKITQIAGDETTARLALNGKLMDVSAAELMNTCERFLCDDKQVTLDLYNVRFVDLSGIKVLIDLLAREVQVDNCSTYLLNKLRKYSVLS